MTTTNPAQTLHSMGTLMKRLEAVTARMEDAAYVFESTQNGHTASAGRSRAQTGSSVKTEVPAQQTAAPPTAPPAPAPAPTPTPAPAAPLVEIPRSVQAYQDQIIEAKVKPFVDFTKSLFTAESVLETVGLAEKEFTLLGNFIKLASACQKPDQSTLESVLAPFPAAIEAVSRAPDAYRREREWGSHLNALASGAAVIGWVAYPTPVSFVTEQKDTVVYYANRIKKERKDKEPKHVQWVNMHMEILDALAAYIKEYHTTGVTWNPKGIPVSEYQSKASASASSPPPPPPPPAPAAPTGSPAPASAPAGGAGIGNVFEELNRGENVTKGLRKVDKSEMTHKNPALRASSVVPAAPAPSAAAPKKPIRPTKPAALAGKKPAKFALEGNKWMIEFQENETITVDKVSLSQSVNIFGCKGATILIKGKVNAVNIINSTKTSVLVESVVSSVSVTSSPSFQIQVTGTAPMIQLDSTDSGQIYLSKDSLNAEITTAKCSAINISLPVEGEDEGIFEEQAVPEMFKTTIVNGKLVTTVVEHSG